VSETVPGALDNLDGEEKNRLYQMLRLEVTPSEEGYQVSGAFCTSGLISHLHPKLQNRVSCRTLSGELQQQSFQRMAQESMNTFMQLFNIPNSYLQEGMRLAQEDMPGTPQQEIQDQISKTQRRSSGQSSS
jgi:hypothetical protein